MRTMNFKTKAIRFAFRKPRFPLICDLDGDLFAAQSPAALQRRLAGLEFPDERKARFVDANGESWRFLQNETILAPEFPMRRLRKIEIILCGVRPESGLYKILEAARRQAFRN
jgi:hypothetical protein